MIYVRFVGDAAIYVCTGINAVGHHCSLTFQDKPIQNTAGWVFSNRASMSPILGDYTAYTTIYRVEGNTVTYSNDGSVYTEPTE